MQPDFAQEGKEQLLCWTVKADGQNLFYIWVSEEYKTIAAY